MGASVMLQVLYFVLVASTYRITDMSQTYPIMRGTAPLLVATVSVFLLSEPLSAFAWLGIAVISLGILSMVAAPSAGNRKGLVLALSNAGVVSALVLQEHLTRVRVVAACIIAIGAVVLRLG
ncbi:hypothetical protein HX791_15485 [Pseudomonas costantinii]|nr:hypothetical protein [Pseudomonas costantinii]